MVILQRILCPKGVSDKGIPCHLIYLSYMQKKVCQHYFHMPKRRAVSGISASRGAPAISHLSFADDSVIFAKATINECAVISRI